MNFTRTFLTAVVDTLLPGLPAEKHFPALPAASQINVDQRLARHLTKHPDKRQLIQALEAIVHQAGSMSSFEVADPETATAFMKEVEKRENEAFSTLLFVVAADYYEDKVVLQAFGWPGRPPQPQGYNLPPFNEKLLEPVKKTASAAKWRNFEDKRKHS